jgi:Txe/YoeB family toxin of Txe-Axe toxin-antitoxin module
MPAAERLAWTAAAWEDDLVWQGQDRRPLKRINQLIQACLRDAFVGIGKPEPLREHSQAAGRAASTTSIGSSTGWRGPHL